MSFYDDASWLLIPEGIKEDVVYAQKPTNGLGDLQFTRASDATRTNSAGVIERTPWNLATWSEMFSNVAWVKTATTVSIDSAVAPNGTLTADTLTADGANSFHTLAQIGNAINGVTYTQSIYAKRSTNNFIQIIGSGAIYTSGAVFANFDLLNGTLGSSGGGAVATITNVGNGWYRCTMTATATTTTTSGSHFFANIIQSATSARAESSTLTTSVFIWGAQVVEGTDAKPYFATTNRQDVPRLDYRNADGTLNSCPRLLLEPQRTNLALHSEDFTNAVWNKDQVTATANVVNSPNGYQNADAIVENTATSGHRTLLTAGISGTGSSAYSFSVYVKKIEGQPTRHIYWMCQISGDAIYAHFNMTTFTVNQVGSNGTGSGASASITPVGNNWYRLSLSGVVSTTTAQYFNQLYFETTPRTGFSPESYTGNGTSGFYVWGWQQEAGAYPTTFIPTTTAAVTRLADAASKTGVSSLIGQTEGTIFINVNNRILGQTNRNLFQVSDSTGNNFIAVNYSSAQASTIRFFVFANGGVAALTFIINTEPLLKLAVAYKNGVYRLFINGTLRYTQTGASFSSNLESVYLGVNRTLGDAIGEGIDSFQVFKTELTNAQLAEITTL